MSCGGLGSGGDPDAQAGKGWGRCLDLRLEVKWDRDNDMRGLYEEGRIWKFVSGFTRHQIKKQALLPEEEESRAF